MPTSTSAFIIEVCLQSIQIKRDTREILATPCRGATIVCYTIAGTCAILSSLCFSGYAVEFPVAGGSFTFILHTFGEFWAWITATNLIFNYGADTNSTS